MSNTVKMIAVVDGKEQTVGRCHPGQARLLQKQGLAEWRDGKVWFKAPPAAEEPSLQNAPIPDDKRVSIHNVGTATFRITTEKLSPPANDEWKPEMFGMSVESSPIIKLSREALAEEISEIDPEGLLKGDPFPMTTYLLDSLRQYCMEIAERVAAGHELHCCDDPMVRTIGFADYTESVLFEIPLTILKGAPDSALSPLGDPEEVRDAFRSPSGRSRLLGNTPEEFGPGPDMNFEEIETLRNLWESAPEEHPANAKVEFHSRRGLLERRGHMKQWVSPWMRRHVPKVLGWRKIYWPEEEDFAMVQDKDGNPYPKDTFRDQDDLSEVAFRREGDRLHRVFWSPHTKQATWDQSILEEDGTYRVLELCGMNGDYESLWDVVTSVEGMLKE